MPNYHGYSSFPSSAYDNWKLQECEYETRRERLEREEDERYAREEARLEREAALEEIVERLLEAPESEPEVWEELRRYPKGSPEYLSALREAAEELYNP